MRWIDADTVRWAHRLMSMSMTELGMLELRARGEGLPKGHLCISLNTMLSGLPIEATGEISSPETGWICIAKSVSPGKQRLENIMPEGNQMGSSVTCHCYPQPHCPPTASTERSDPGYRHLNALEVGPCQLIYFFGRSVTNGFGQRPSPHSQELP